ncbi:hypothetical protein [Actinomadura violacea]|uniref:Uncharacterized protein n=1 Tax=Actinomadura violacea TaxID=2819934 RepID=A0ABS3RY66_9ACTN|nr:hypothetical protein [Actinomadura violacea]MBO2461586.1 hypothetical protein [Actinomadura violacea]
MQNAATAATAPATTPQELRDRAAAHHSAAEESFERSGMDGALTQWAHGRMAGLDLLKADLAENGGKAMFPALFDTDGRLVPAKLITVNRGYDTDDVFGLLPDDTGRGRFTGWFNPSKAERKGVARRNDAKKGYYVGYVMAPAKAELAGGNVCTVMPVTRRTDGGWSKDVEIVDNGHGDTDLHRWYSIQDGTYWEK